MNTLLWRSRSIRLVICILAVTAVGAGCSRDPYECGSGEPCLQGGIKGICVESSTAPERKFCAFPDSDCPSGYRYGVLSGGDSKECVANLADAGTPDGPSGPAIPPVTNGQPAEQVLGQSDLTSGDANHGGLGPGSMSAPSSVASDGSSLLVGDSSNSRVLKWGSIPTGNGPPANDALGQTSLSAAQIGPTQILFGGDSNLGTWISGGKMFVADAGDSRVLIWKDTFGGTGKPADVVVGQSSFTSRSAGTGANQLDSPAFVWSDGSVLIVSDSVNGRLLIWHSIPTANGSSADIVIGRPAFGAPPGPADAATLAFPQQVAWDGRHLFVADAAQNRVLVWNGLPSENGQPADYVIGQPTLTSTAANAGGSVAATGLNNPTGVFSYDGSLFVSDTLNHRVLVYTPSPEGMGAAATRVLGQSSLDLGGSPLVPAADRMKFPAGLFAVGHRLYVTDPGFNRVLVFRLNQ